MHGIFYFITRVYNIENILASLFNESQPLWQNWFFSTQILMKFVQNEQPVSKPDLFPAI